MADQTETLEAPEKEHDPLDALDTLENPFLHGDGSISEPEQQEPQEERNDSQGGLSQEDEKEVSDALRRVLGGHGDDEPEEESQQHQEKPNKLQNKGLRDQLRDRNRQFDELNTQLQEREERLKELKEQYEAAEKEKAVFQESLTSRYNVTDYSESSDPDIAAIDQEIRKSLSEAKISLPKEESVIFEQNMVPLVNAYQKAVDTGDGARLQRALDEHFPDNSKEVLSHIRQINFHIQKRVNTINDNRSKHFQRVIGGYEEKLTTNQRDVSAIGSLPIEEAIKNPKDLNSIISVAAHHDPNFKQEVERIQKTCAKFAAGPRPFDVRDSKWKPYIDPDNPSRLTPEGEDIRRKEVFQYEEAQRVLPKTLCQMWAAASLVPNLVERLSKYEARVKDEQSEPDLRVSSEDPKAPSSMGDIDFDKIGDPMDVKNPFL